MRGYRKILIAVNGSMDTLRQGLRLASDEKTWVTVIKVIPTYEGDLNLTGVKNIGDVLSSGIEGVVSGINEVASGEGALIKVRVEEGDISSRIKEVAAEERCDLIIMGGRRRTGWSKYFGGGILRRVLDDPPCPVFVVGDPPGAQAN